MLYIKWDDYDEPVILGRMSDEPYAKTDQTRRHTRMCSEGVFRCVSDSMGLMDDHQDKVRFGARMGHGGDGKGNHNDRTRCVGAVYALMLLYPAKDRMAE